MFRACCIALLVLLCPAAAMAGDEDIFDVVEHHYAKNGDVKIHYVTLGQGPVVLFVHGFPDWWYTWRHQMAGLQDKFKCVAMDTRGYNKSDKPAGIEQYKIEHLLDDVDAVRQDLGVDQLILAGHDWGGYISWRYAMAHPDRVEKLVIFNLTHPRGYANVIANATPEQTRNTNYARRFASSKPGGGQSAVVFAAVAANQGEVVAGRYRTAMESSDYDSMLNYYRANYGQVSDGAEIPNIACPVLQFHGLLDRAVDKDGLMRTWEWIDKDYTLVTLPDVDHWVQRDGAEIVTTTMRWWLLSRM